MGKLISQTNESPSQSMAPGRITTRGRRPTFGCMPQALSGEGLDIWNGAEEVARQLDANLICFAFSDNDARVFFNIISHEALDGLVISAGGLAAIYGSPLVTSFCSRNHLLPMISIGQKLRGVPSLLIDNYNGMRAVILHLIETHHYQHIAFIRGPDQSWEARERWRAYRDVLAEKKVPFNPDLVTPPAPGWDDPDTEWGARILLEQRKLQPGIDFQAVVAANDWEVIGMLRALQAQGVVVPRDVALAGFNDDPRSRNLIPGITTVPASGYEQGRLATRALFAGLLGEQIPEQVLVPSQLIVRESCGCVSSTVTEASAGPLPSESQLDLAQISEERADIHSAMTQAFGSMAEQVQDGMLVLLDAFLGELSGDPQCHFITILYDLIRQTIALGCNISQWQAVISTLRRRSLPYIQGDDRVRAADLWEQARVAIGEMAERSQRAQTMQAEKKINALNVANQALYTNFNLKGILDTLAVQIASLGIQGCYLSLYEDSTKPESWSRLIFACKEFGRMGIPENGVRFPTQQLMPPEFWPDSRRYSMIAAPLNYRGSEIGMVLFELGPQDWAVYDSLRKTLSTVLFESQLVEQFEKKSVRLSTAAEVSHAASSLLDLDDLVKQVVELLQARFDLYYAGIFLVDESKQWAVLRAGTGEAGQVMLEHGHRLEVDGTSTVGWCVAHKQARIALDVGEEAIRFDNPLLPKTRSELALPLISRGEMIGALSIQSDLPSAFNPEDVTVFQTLSNQLANAIANAQLLDQTHSQAGERQEAEADLSRERFLLRTLIENLSDRIYVKDSEGRYIVANQEQARYVGAKSPVEIIGKTDFDFYPSDLAAKQQANETIVFESEHPITNKEELAQDIKGNTSWALTTIAPYRNSLGYLTGLIGVSRDISEKKHTTELLAHEQGLLHELLENSPDFIFIQDREFRFVRANQAYAQIMLGLDSSDELIGKTEFELFPTNPEAFRADHIDEREIMATGKAVIGRERQVVLGKTGKKIWVAEYRMPVHDHTGKVVGLISQFRDITAQKQAKVDFGPEQRFSDARGRTLQFETVAEIARVMNSESDPDRLLQLVLDQLQERFGLYYAGLFLVDQSGERADDSKKYAVLRAGTGSAGKIMLENYYQLEIGEAYPVGTCIAQKEICIARDVNRATDYVDNPFLPETRSELAIPLIYRGEVLGALSIHATQSSAFTREDIAVFQSITDHLSSVISNIRLSNTLVREQVMTTALMDNLPDSIYFKDERSRFIRNSRSHARTLGVANPANLIGKTDFDFFTPQHARPAFSDEQEIIRSGQPKLNIEERETWPDRPDTWVLTSKLPLRDQKGQIIGTFGISKDISQYKQVEKDREELLKEVRRRALQLQTAAEVARAASSILNPDELFNQTVNLMRDRFNLYYAGLFLVDETGRWAVLHAGTGAAGQQLLSEGWRLPVGGASMIGRCIARGQADIQLDIDKATVHLRNPYLTETRSEMALPLISRGQVLGALTIQSTQPAAFSSEDITIMQTLTDQLANAIENARLFEQNRSEIEERRQTEEILARERALLRTLIDNLPDRIYVKDAEGRFMIANQSVARHVGVTSPELLVGKTDFDFYPREFANQYHSNEVALLQSGKSLVDQEEIARDSQGNLGWTLTSKIPLTDPQGKITGLVGMGRDITERKRTEQERERLLDDLQRRAVQLQTAAEVSHAASSILDRDMLISQAVNLLRDRFNLYYAGLYLLDQTGSWAVLHAGTGEAGQQMLSQGWRLPVGDGSMIGRCIARSQADIQLDIDKATVHLRNPYLPATRSELALPLISRGETIGALTIQSTLTSAFSSEDITTFQTLTGELANAIENARLFEQNRREIEERRQAEAALDQERTLLRTLIDNLPDFVYVKDTEGRFLLKNSADIRWMGANSIEEVLGKTDFDFYPAELASKFYEDDMAVLRANAPLEKEEQTFSSQGEMRWTLTTKLPLRDAHGNIIGLVGIGRDITSVMLVEQRLAQERNLLRTLIDNLPDVVYYKDNNSRILIANKAQARLMGAASPEELVGKTDFDYLDKNLATKYFSDEQELLRTGKPSVNIEESALDPSGNQHWLATTRVPLTDAAGRLIGFVGVGRDITDQKRAEQEREQLLNEMQRRNVQLQTAAEVARAVSSLLDPDSLIQQVVELVRDRFGLYYTGLFLVDDSNRWAVLQSGTGEAGREMLAKNWRLEVGGASMIGHCIASGQADIQMDVGQAPVHLRNPYLPETRSEIALPLVSRGQTIGALTIQSSQVGFLNEADIAVLQTMTSQIANAIENARLFEKSQAALSEMEATHRRYTLQAWKEYTRSHLILGYQQEGAQRVLLQGEPHPVFQQVISQQTNVIEKDASDAPVLIVPLMLRDQAIGAWGVKASEGKKTWTDEEITMIQEIGQQFALAADTLRLLDETQRRAARERLVTEITMKMRATNDPQAILQTAVSELRQALQTKQAQILLKPESKNGDQ